MHGDNLVSNEIRTRVRNGFDVSYPGAISDGMPKDHLSVFTIVSEAQVVPSLVLSSILNHLSESAETPSQPLAGQAAMYSMTGPAVSRIPYDEWLRPTFVRVGPSVPVGSDARSSSNIIRLQTRTRIVAATSDFADRVVGETYDQQREVNSTSTNPGQSCPKVVEQ